MRHRSAILATVAALLLAACGGATTPPPAAPPTAPTEAPAAPAPTEAPAAAPTAAPDAAVEPPAEQSSTTIGSGAIKIRLWSHQNNSFNQANQELIDRFVKANPDVEVTYETFPFDVFIQTLQTSLPAGTTADIIELPGTYTCRYAQGGQLLEVPDNMMTVGMAGDTFFAAPAQAFTCDGKLYGFPNEYNLEYGGAYVNPALFEKHAVAYPPAWKTWGDMVQDSAKLVETENDQMSKAGLHFTNSDQIFTYFLSGILEQGGSYFADDGRHFTFDTPEAISTIQLMADMVSQSKVVDPVLFNADSNWVGDSFAQGNVGVAILGSWYGGEAKLNYPDLTFDYVTLPPMFGSEYRFVSAGGWGKVVAKTSQNPDVAWKLAQFMSANQESALLFAGTTGTIPAMKSVIEQPELVQKAPFLKATFALLPYGQYHGDLIDANQLAYEIIYPAILDVLQGAITPEAAAQQIHEEANAMVDANR